METATCYLYARAMPGENDEERVGVALIHDPDGWHGLEGKHLGVIPLDLECDVSKEVFAALSLICNDETLAFLVEDIATQACKLGMQVAENRVT